MSVISFNDSIAGASTETLYLELARPFLGRVTLGAFSAADLTNLLEVRISSNGYTLLPTPSGGGQSGVYVDNHIPVTIEVKKSMSGPPYNLEITVVNANAGAVIVYGMFEVYNTPYPQTRVHVPYGTEGANPFEKIIAQIYEQYQPKKE